MLRYLLQLKDIQRKHGGVPILCAGDVFDLWHSVPELINFAWANLPGMYAIPGQHDLPNHSYINVHKSAYWTLVQSGRIRNLTNHAEIPDVGTIYPFMWGQDVRPAPKDPVKGLKIALIHAYVWRPGHAYDSASEDDNLDQWKTRLEGYDVAIFGDNHSGFLSKALDCRVINCGCMIPRSSREHGYTPTVGLIHANGVISREPFVTSEDCWLTDQFVMNSIDKTKPVGMKLAALLEGISDLSEDSLDFTEAVKVAVQSVGLGSGALQFLKKALRHANERS